MARKGKIDIQELIDFKNELERELTGNKVELFIESCAKELAARLLAKVVKRTPVGQYPSGSGKVGGTLRRGWTGGKGQSGLAFAQNLKVRHSGNLYTIEITNPVEYASYVEFGHRTRNGKGWVEGHFMLTVSEEEIRGIAPKVLEKKLKKRLGEIFK